MLRAFGYPADSKSEKDRAALARMTNDEAQRIIAYISGYEIPQFHVLSLEFALFKVGLVPPPLLPSFARGQRDIGRGLGSSLVWR